ncbi:hypothetical protein N7495_002328 [Penicillium taxi]|uniref:uncharacterized protein n=1 Tax=Penicillium taxi TaxID=168475 RepID=UPI002544FFEA|nr:uncharacterized protein N7495_002328 [Penicillium taxi]KAJ5901800.1 hypothetical protein N7495_002328 [Penicillium taxi]
MSTLPLPGGDLSARTAAKSPRLKELLFSQTQNGYTTISIPATYGYNTGLSPGAIAGIVLGSVAGLCILLYILFISLLKVGFKPHGNRGGPITARSMTSRTIDEEVVRSRRGSRSPRRRGSVIEVVEDRRGNSYRRAPSHDHVVVEESESGTATTDPRNVVEVFEEESSVSSASRPSRRSRSHRSRTRIVEPHDHGSSHGGSQY